jgi:hypothetical protein
MPDFFSLFPPQIQSHAVPLAQLKAEAQKEAEEEKQQKSLVEDTSSFWNITSSVFSLYSYCISLTCAPLIDYLSSGLST